MRAFLAAEFNPALEGPATEAQNALKGRAGGGFRWAPPGRIHLTLRFLGEIPEGIAPGLGQAVSAAVAGLHGFPLGTSGYGAFPDPAHARIVWLGLADPTGGLPRLLAALDTALSPFALPWEERPFVAHLTLGRHRGGGADLGPAFRNAGSPAATAHLLEGVALCRSVPGPSGPIHTRLALAPMAEPRPAC
jgi:2'-5' RNA ligase